MAIAEYSTFYLQNLFLLYVLGHCPLVIWSAIQSTLLHLTESGQRVYISQYTSELIRLLLSSVTLSLNTSNPVPLEAMHAHSIIHHVSQMMLCALYRELFQAFVFLSFWYRFILISAIQRMFSRSGLALLNVFGKVKWPCLHLVVNPLYMLLWNLLLIVDFNTPISWRVFFSWLDVVKERILRSSTTVVLRGRPGLFILLSPPMHSLFLRMYQTVDLTTRYS